MTNGFLGGVMRGIVVLLFGLLPIWAVASFVSDEHSDHNHQPIINNKQAHFDHWLASHPEQRQLAFQYRSYLLQYVLVPPMQELLTTARDWQACNAAAYEVPPPALWHNIVPTLQLYAILQHRNLLPEDTVIRSVYRNPALNDCAGGAKGSKHLNNAAIDIWSELFFDPVNLSASQNALCQFWYDYGEYYNMGLGLYATGAIHLDTQGYRKWGGQYSDEGSPCRTTINGGR